MFFSIIIPAFNAEKTIEYALSSVIKQSFTDFEVIIINDGSTDNTTEMCERFILTDNRFKTIQQANLGASAARNNGIKSATGDYVVFLDSDDCYSADYLFELKKMIDEQTDCDNYWCSFDTDIKSTTSDSNTSIVELFDKTQIMDLHAKMYDNVLWNKAFKRDILIKNQIFMPEDLSLGEDLIFNLRYLDCTNGKIAINTSPLYHYSTANNNSLDRKYRSDLLEIFQRIDQTLLNYLNKWNVDDSQMQLYYNSVFFHFEKVLYNTYRPECCLSKREKKKYNSNILKNKQFQHALNQSNCYINKLYKLAYSKQSWNSVYFLWCLNSIKQNFFKRFFR